MSVGQDKDSIQIIEKSPAGDTWEKTFLGLPVVFEPGTHFLYNSGASYMLSSIISKVTGKSVHEYLKPRLYEPLGITGATWTENAEGVNMGSSNLRIRTEDIGKLGQLYLQQGNWNGQQLVSREWVALDTKKEIETTGKNDSSWGFGYGYQFWMNPTGGFRADGAYGQYSMVFPDKDTSTLNRRLRPPGRGRNTPLIAINSMPEPCRSVLPPVQPPLHSWKMANQISS